MPSGYPPRLSVSAVPLGCLNSQNGNTEAGRAGPDRTPAGFRDRDRRLEVEEENHGGAGEGVGTAPEDLVITATVVLGRNQECFRPAGPAGASQTLGGAHVHTEENPWAHQSVGKDGAGFFEQVPRG